MDIHNSPKKGSTNGEVNFSYVNSQNGSLNQNNVNNHYSSSSNQSKSKKQKEKGGRLKVREEFSFWSKMCFAIAGAPYQMYFSALSVFSTVFLLEKAMVPPGKVTWIIFVSR